MRLLLLLIFITLSTTLSAVEFDVYQSEYRPLNIALIVDSGAEHEREKMQLYHVVKNDLVSSQSFQALDPLSFIADSASTMEQIDYVDWRIIGADLVATCRLTKTGQKWQAEVKIHDPFRSKLLAVSTLSRDATGLRVLSHQVADFIYRSVIGVRGHFNSQILYVTKKGEKSDLIYMDQDGANRQTVGKNFTLLLSPDWAPGGRFVALNTYVGNRPRLETFDLTTGERVSFGSFKGLNSTPEYSPDGRYIAAALSYTGNAEIHLYDVEQRTWRQFTHHPGIDTTPTWSPDGKWIAFTSNRNGTPQIYRKKLSGGQAERISLEASYNTSPVWAPHGDRIAFITLKNWEYALATVHIDGSGLRYLATGDRIESPSWSPNGQMLLYSAEYGGIRRVYRIPAWGGKAEPVTPGNMDASDPVWSR
ncbi:MAG: Tol-Pal system beta propeller repeat protein TolB [Mariprofundaceae bacterium]|nr:Tol-Pal system beta propeller repeat protein TolB [Mariprofundaceae bacterium]